MGKHTQQTLVEKIDALLYILYILYTIFTGIMKEPADECRQSPVGVSVRRQRAKPDRESERIRS